MRSLAQELQPEPGFQAGLEKKLMENKNPKAVRPASHKTNWIPVLGWSALAVVLITVMTVVLGTLLPRGILPAASSEVPAASQPVTCQGSCRPAPRLTLLPAARSRSQPHTAAHRAGRAALPHPARPGLRAFDRQPDQDFHLQADFPASPPEVNVYRQLAPAG